MAEEPTIKADTTPQKQEPVVPQFDASELATSVKQDVLSTIEAKFPELTADLSAKVKQDIIKSIVGDTGSKPWVPKTYDEIVDKAVARFDEKLKEMEKASTQRTVQQQEDYKKAQADWDKYWNGQIDKLVEEGDLPAMPEELAKKLAEGKTLTDQEKNDPSFKARMDLYAKSKELQEAGDVDWYNLRLASELMKRTNRINPRFAPVQSRSAGVVNRDAGGRFSIREIRGKSMSQIAREGIVGR